MTAPSNIIEFCLKIIQLISITTIEEEKKPNKQLLGMDLSSIEIMNQLNRINHMKIFLFVN